MTYHHKALKQDGKWVVVCEEVPAFKEEWEDDVQGACDRAALLNQQAEDALIRKRTRAMPKHDNG